MRSRRSTAAKAVWLLALLVALASVGVIGYAAAIDPALLGQAPPTPSRPPAATLPTARPLATEPSPTTSPPPSPSQPAPSDPASRFARFAADPNVSFHLEADGTARAGRVRLHFSMALDQSGPDSAIALSMRMSGRSANFKLIVKDDVAYIREGRGKWILAGDAAAFDLPSSFMFSQLKADQAVFVRSATRRGNELHLLRVPSTAAAGVDTAELKRLGCDTDDLGLDLWVRTDGSPVSATFDYSCIHRSASGEERWTASASYQFSRVGRPTVIKPPKKFRSL